MSKVKDDFAPADIPLSSGAHASVTPDAPLQMLDAVADVMSRLQATRTFAIPEFMSADPETQLLAIRAEQLSASLPMNIPVLITGASGTGKELLARRFRLFGVPFVALNMAAMPEQLITSLLFGHTRGSFTGATQDSKGAFIAAGAGVLFLDEIGDMPMHLQPVLLRVLQERVICKVGSTIEEPVCCRIVAATNVDINDTTKIRADLAARLSMITLKIKPLSARPCDVELIGERCGLDKADLVRIYADPDKLATLSAHNVRALQAWGLRKQYMGDIFA